MPAGPALASAGPAQQSTLQSPKEQALAGSWGAAVPSPSQLLQQARAAAELNQALDRLGSDMHAAASVHNASGGHSPREQAAGPLAAAADPLPARAGHAGAAQRPPLGPAPSASQLPAAQQLQAELLTEALSASASRLLVHRLLISRVHVLMDVHVTRGAMVLDTNRSGPAQVKFAC